MNDYILSLGQLTLLFAISEEYMSIKWYQLRSVRDVHFSRSNILEIMFENP